MDDFNVGFRYGYQHGRGAADLVQMSRMAPTPKNDPRLLAPTKVRCLRPFYVGGKALKIGEVVELQRHDALSLAALGKAEMVK